MWSQVSACEENEGEGGGGVDPCTKAIGDSSWKIRTEPWKETNQGVRGSGLIWP